MEEKEAFMMSEYKYNRVFLIVMDSVGIGEAPDAADFNDIGANTLGHIAEHMNGLHMPHMAQLGLGLIGDIKGVEKRSTLLRTTENAGGVKRERYDDGALGDYGIYIENRLKCSRKDFRMNFFRNLSGVQDGKSSEISRLQARRFWTSSEKNIWKRVR